MGNYRRPKNLKKIDGKPGESRRKNQQKSVENQRNKWRQTKEDKKKTRRKF